jgi:nucleoside-diphosphate-sugar epimerase
VVHVFIIGGAGKIGQRLCRILSGRGHAVRALYRKPEQQALLGELGAEPVSGSLTELDAAALAMHFAGSDTVVFTAGAGGKGGRR